MVKRCWLGLILVVVVILSGCTRGPFARATVTPLPLQMAVQSTVVYVAVTPAGSVTPLQLLLTPTATATPIPTDTPASGPPPATPPPATPTSAAPPPVTSTSTAPAQPPPTPSAADAASPPAPQPPPTTLPTATVPATAAPATSPTVAASPTVPAGDIVLVEPENGLTMPPLVRDFEFKWRWTGAEGCTLPPGYAFELRIWAPMAGTGPLAAMDVIGNQNEIFCDPLNGVYSFTVSKIKDTPGARSVAVQTAATGTFNWDVALVRLFPTIEVVQTSPPAAFTIPGDYVGPYDTSRRTVSCLQIADWLEAQALFLATGGPGPDLNGLDPDGNGIACDELRSN